MVMEVKKGVIKGDVHDCLFPKRVPPNRLFVSANIGAGEKVNHIAWLSMPHGPIEGWFPCTWGDFCA